ncbi:MAG: hypothetical protein AB7F86_11310 [Bdellovibrionales bacterium]
MRKSTVTFWVRVMAGVWALGLGLTCVAFAQEGTSRSELSPLIHNRKFEMTGDWKFDLGGANGQEAKDAYTAAYVYFSSNFDFNFAKIIKARISPWARAFSGRSQDRFDDGGLDNKISLHEFWLGVEPLPFVELRAGAHHQGVLGSPMLVSGLRTFPGLQEIFKAKFTPEFEGKIVLQQVVPTSSSLNDEREDVEPLPWFRTEHIEFKGRAFRKLEWKVFGGRYAWQDIPMKVATESAKHGNSLDTNGYSLYGRLTYQHKGYFGGSTVCFCDDENGYGIVGEYMRSTNTEVPSGLADSQLIGIGPKVTIGDVEVDVRYRKYFIEPEATVAAYNKSRFGNTNRDGHNAEVNLKFLKHGFSLYGEMYQAKPLDKTKDQHDMALYYLGVETDYASF